MPTNPFLDQELLATLYSDAGRLAARTSALHQAKIVGEDSTQTICDLLDGAIDSGSQVADLGCGRGTTSIALARRYQLRHLVALDQSQALLACAAARFTAAGLNIHIRQGDFHRLPIASSTLDAAVAAFCLYHSPDPGRVIGEIARCLRRFGTAVLVTKSEFSYTDLDEIVTDCGLDPHAYRRPSLYSAFHSGNMRSLTSDHLHVTRTVEQRHLFQFRDFAHLAAYLATTPRYRIDGDTAQITAKLRAWQSDRPVTMSSTVSYVLATLP